MFSRLRSIYYLLGGFSVIMIAMQFMKEQPYTDGGFDNDREIRYRDEIHNLKNETRKREGFEHVETFDKILDGQDISVDETVQIKDYKAEDYIQYEVCSTYFYEEGNMGYELVIAQAPEEENWVREAKVFVSEKVNDMYCLKQILHNENHDGAAWDSRGLHLVDVNFDGEKDILVQNGHYGAQGLVLYNCYLYEQGNYVGCESFTDISNAEIDAKNQWICSSWRNSAGSHSQAIYVYENGKYHMWKELTEEILVNTDGGTADVWQWTEKENDVVVKRIINKDCPQEEIDSLYGAGSIWDWTETIDIEDGV